MAIPCPRAAGVTSATKNTKNGRELGRFFLDESRVGFFGRVGFWIFLFFWKILDFGMETRWVITKSRAFQFVHSIFGQEQHGRPHKDVGSPAFGGPSKEANPEG